MDPHLRWAKSSNEIVQKLPWGDCCTAITEGLLLPLCGYLSCIVGSLQVIIQLYRSSTMNSLCRHVFYMTASMLLI